MAKDKDYKNYCKIRYNLSYNLIHVLSYFDNSINADKTYKNLYDLKNYNNVTQNKANNSYFNCKGLTYFKNNIYPKMNN